MTYIPRCALLRWRPGGGGVARREARGGRVVLVGSVEVNSLVTSGAGAIRRTVLTLARATILAMGRPGPIAYLSPVKVTGAAARQGGTEVRPRRAARRPVGPFARRPSRLRWPP